LALKSSEIVGVAQMLAYAHTSLERQNNVWGLVTNGLNYRFFYIVKRSYPEGNRAVKSSGKSVQHITYQYMPSLNLIDVESVVTLLQVLKVIREWQPV
jgi:hypothetical protein